MTTRKHSPPAVSSSARARILLVDDSEDLREVVHAALEQNGYQVTSASSAEEAYRLACEHPVDLVISDVMMGEGPTGLGLVSRLHSDLPPPVPAIIVCSGFHEFESESKRRGAVFLAKPFELDDLLMLVARTLDGRKPNSRLVARAAHATQRLCRQATVDAEEFLRSLGALREEIRGRAQIAAEWTAGFLGVRSAVVAFVADGELRVEATNDEERLPAGTALSDHVPLLREVFESASSMILMGSAAVAACRGDGTRYELIAAVPVRAPGGLSVGALCLLDDRPVRLAAEDLELLDFLGRRACQAIAEPASKEPPIPLFEVPGVLEAGAFERILDMTLRRASAMGSSLEVAVASLATRRWPQIDTAALGLPEHSAIGWLGAGRFALFVSAEGDLATGRMVHSLAALDEQVGIAGTGVVGIHLDRVPPTSDHELLRLAVQVERRARNSPGRVLRLVIQTEPWDLHLRQSGHPGAAPPAG